MTMPRRYHPAGHCAGRRLRLKDFSHSLLWSWYVPNKACVAAWLETCGMEITRHSWWHDHPHQRLHVVARKNKRIQTTVDNPVW